MINWVRRIYGAWIFVISAITAIRFAFYGIHIGAPNWLIVCIAGLETISAGIFIWRANGFATAGLCSSFSAAMVVHVIVKNEVPWLLVAYAIFTLAIHAHQQKFGMNGNSND